MKRISIYFMVALFVTAISCDDFLDVNTSPNEPANAPVELMFPSAAGSAAYVIGGWYQILGGMWAQHWTQSVGASQYRNIDSYDLQTDFMDDWQFGELYTGSLKDLEQIRTVSKRDGNWSYYLMATTVQAYVYQVLVDLYDKVPFTEALKGDQNILTPKFDDGDKIYDSLIVRLNDALSKNLSAPTVQSPGKDDVIFNGDLDNWVKFANTLKLKIYLRQSEARPDVAEAGIESLFVSPNFLTSSATFSAFKDEEDNRNPVYETGVSRLGGNISVSRTLHTFLLDTDDPRRDSIMAYPKNTPTVHNTLVQGDYLAATPVNIDGLSKPKLYPLDSVYFISAAESYFLQAEAVARYGVSGDAEELYQAGISESFKKLGVATDPAIIYGEGAPYEFPEDGTFSDKLEAIITQKWISFANTQGLEAFFEHNRTGYPDIFTPAVNNVTNDKLPKRLFFPQSERSRNPANLPEIKPITEPVWWAQ